MLQKTAAEFAEKYVEPRAEEIDRTGEFPRDIFEKMCQVGLRVSGRRKNTVAAAEQTLIKCWL